MTVKTSINLFKAAIFLLIFSLISSCYFFRKRATGGTDDEASPASAIQSIGQRAGTSNPELLSAVHAATSTHAPAGIRPDPDVFVRNLLLQYREQGSTVARQIGRVENYRLLLGGASEDFSVVPQVTYDATSLLAKLKVAEEVCEGLVNPNNWQHPGWTSILPSEPNDASTNINFLVQRIIGTPTADITAETTASLNTILETARVSGQLTNESYVIVCATLVIDAGALLL